MTRGMTATKWVGIGLVVLIIVADGVLVACHVPTLSYGLTWLLKHWTMGWLVPFVLGALVGHWCWGQADA